VHLLRADGGTVDCEQPFDRIVDLDGQAENIAETRLPISVF